MLLLVLSEARLALDEERARVGDDALRLLGGADLALERAVDAARGGRCRSAISRSTCCRKSEHRQALRPMRFTRVAGMIRRLISLVPSKMRLMRESR